MRSRAGARARPRHGRRRVAATARATGPRRRRRRGCAANRRASERWRFWAPAARVAIVAPTVSNAAPRRAAASTVRRRCYTFAMVTSSPSAQQVARPGSLALASLRRHRRGADRLCGVRRPARAGASRCAASRSAVGSPPGARDVETRPAGEHAMTELEFKSLAAQGYNRIPLIAEAFADLETPLSLYLKLGPRRRAAAAHSFLLESVVGGERFGRYSFIGLPARTLLRATGFKTEVVDRRRGRRDARRQSARLHRRIPAALQGRAAARLPRFCGGLAGYFGYDAVRYIEKKLAARRAKPGGHRHARHPAAACRGARGHRQPVGPALPDRLRRPGAARGLSRRQRRRLAELADALRTSVTAPAGRARRAPSRSSANSRKDDYLAAVREAKEYIAAGDMMQVQVGQRLRKRYAELAAVPVPRAALAQSVALHVLLRLRRLPDRRRLARDPGAPRATRRAATR